MLLLFGSYLVENMGTYFLLYFNQVFNALDFGDLIPATIKVSFGFAIGLVGCFKGYYCKKRNCRLVAANSAVVYTPCSLYY
jgi:phospholipid/cholesterol/gamma-HCH transport system permease protein